MATHLGDAHRHGLLCGGELGADISIEGIPRPDGRIKVDPADAAGGRQEDRGPGQRSHAVEPGPISHEHRHRDGLHSSVQHGDVVAKARNGNELPTRIDSNVIRLATHASGVDVDDDEVWLRSPDVLQHVLDQLAVDIEPRDPLHREHVHLRVPLDSAGGRERRTGGRRLVAIGERRGVNGNHGGQDGEQAHEEAATGVSHVRWAVLLAGQGHGPQPYRMIPRSTPLMAPSLFRSDREETVPQSAST